MRKIISLFILQLFLVFPAYAANVAEDIISDAKIVGEGRLTYLLFDVYDSTLYAPGGKFEENSPHALSLRYLRNLDGKAIAERSVEEMRGQGFKDDKKLALWLEQMGKIFPDVKNGTELTAVFIPGKYTEFYQGGKMIGRVDDPEFTKQFSNIWLSEKTSEPELRRKLLGLI